MITDIQRAFRRARAEISPRGLLIGNLMVVESWEAGIQRRLVSRTVRPRGSVLEIGYGLGFAANEILLTQPNVYTVVEANMTVAARAREALSGSRAEVICDFWQNLTPPASGDRYDHIVYDPYPLRAVKSFDGSVEMSLEHIMEFLPKSREWLGVGGRLGFLDFSREVHTHRLFVERCGEMSLTFQAFSERLAGVRTCSGKQVAHVIVVTA